MAVRDAEMKTWGKSKGITNSDEEEGPSEKPKRRKRRSGVNALQYLEAKCQADAEVKKEEVALRQQELALQQKRQGSFKLKCFSNSSTYSSKYYNSNSSSISNSSKCNKLKI